MSSQKEIVYNILQQKPIVRSSEFNKAGVHRETIRRMAEAGEIVKIAHGLYSSDEYIPNEKYSLIEAQKIVNNGIVCLISALSCYEIGTQNPSEVWMAIEKSSWHPQIKNTPVRLINYTGESYTSGVECINIDNEKVKIYNIPKTIADCFKFRNKIGIDVAIEALKDVLENKRTTVDEILFYSEICRVRKIITPYMESLV